MKTAVSRALNKIKEHRSVRAMVEAACWDLRAQVRGQPCGSSGR